MVASHIINSTIDICLSSVDKQYKFGACIFKGPKIYTMGVNNNAKTHTVAYRFANHEYGAIHAEVDALYKHYRDHIVKSNNIKKFDLLVIRPALSDKDIVGFHDSLPCPRCMKYIKEYCSQFIGAVYYFNNNDLQKLII